VLLHVPQFVSARGLGRLALGGSHRHLHAAQQRFRVRLQARAPLLAGRQQSSCPALLWLSTVQLSQLLAQRPARRQDRQQEEATPQHSILRRRMAAHRQTAVRLRADSEHMRCCRRRARRICEQRQSTRTSGRLRAASRASTCKSLHLRSVSHIQAMPGWQTIMQRRQPLGRARLAVQQHHVLRPQHQHAAAHLRIGHGHLRGADWCSSIICPAAVGMATVLR